MAKKKKGLLKKLAKAAVIGGALYAGAKGLGKKGLKGNAAKLTEGDIGKGLRAPRVDDYNYIPKTKIPSDFLDTPTWAAKGGRIGAKGGGIAKRGMGAAYKRGGHVKSMGIAKRGGGVAKR